MTHKERFHAFIERKPVDRPASWLGLPVPDALPGLYDFYSVSDMDGLRNAINDGVCRYMPHKKGAGAEWLFIR